MSAARRDVSFTVNGAAHTVSVYPMERLLDVLRDRTWPYRNQGRLRRGRVRFLLRAHEWRAGEQLPGSRAAGRRSYAVHDRRACRARAACIPCSRRFLNAEGRSAASALRAW